MILKVELYFLVTSEKEGMPTDLQLLKSILLERIRDEVSHKIRLSGNFWEEGHVATFLSDDEAYKHIFGKIVKKK